jgi:hypothetical protein
VQHGELRVIISGVLSMLKDVTQYRYHPLLSVSCVVD